MALEHPAPSLEAAVLFNTLGNLQRAAVALQSQDLIKQSRFCYCCFWQWSKVYRLWTLLCRIQQVGHRLRETTQVSSHWKAPVLPALLLAVKALRLAENTRIHDAFRSRRHCSSSSLRGTCRSFLVVDLAGLTVDLAGLDVELAVLAVADHAGLAVELAVLAVDHASLAVDHVGLAVDHAGLAVDRVGLVVDQVGLAAADHAGLAEGVLAPPAADGVLALPTPPGCLVLRRSWPGVPC